MPIEVIGIDASFKYNVTCYNCASILSFTLADTHMVERAGGNFTSIKCPVCDKVIDAFPPPKETRGSGGRD